jgi:hypothetical protein
VSIEGWHDFFVAQAGAGAALAGLLFVALSINIESIIKSPWLPPRAAVTIVLLVGSVIEALLGLWPHQPSLATGLEELVTSLIVFGFTVRLTVAASRAPKEYASGTFLSALMVQLAAVPALAGAIALSFGFEAGLFPLAFSMLVAIIVAFLNSWVLLVEILR